jgi:hypothetical protein
MHRPARFLKTAVVLAVLALGCKPRGEEDSSAPPGSPTAPGGTEPSAPPGSPTGPGGTEPSAPVPPGSQGGAGGASGGPADPGGGPPASVGAGLPPASASGYVEFDGEIVRLTPEQISNQLERVFGWEARGQGSDGIDYDIISDNLGVALGGIDYRLASNRDPFPRTQTVLISRMLAWDVANSVIFGHVNPPRKPKVRIFTIADLEKDRPDGESAGRWEAQLQDLYWRMFSRAARPEEVQACRNAFLIIADRHQHGSVSAWITVLYSLLSTTEFWIL